MESFEGMLYQIGKTGRFFLKGEQIEPGRWKATNLTHELQKVKGKRVRVTIEEVSE